MNEAIKELKVVTVSKCTEDGAAYIAVLKERTVNVSCRS